MVDGRYYIADTNRRIIGALPDDFSFDCEIGGNDDFQAEIGYEYYNAELHTNGNYIICSGTEWGGIITGVMPDAKNRKIALSGPSFRGLIAHKIVEPPFLQDYYYVRGLYAETAAERLFKYLYGFNSLTYSNNNHMFIEMDDSDYNNKNLLNPTDVTAIEGVQNDGYPYDSSYNSLKIRLTKTSGTILMDIGMALEAGLSYWYQWASITAPTNATFTLTLVRTKDGTTWNAATSLCSNTTTAVSGYFPIEYGYRYGIKLTYSGAPSGTTSYITISKPMIEYKTNGDSPSAYENHQRVSSKVIQFPRYCTLIEAVDLIGEYDSKMPRIRIRGYKKTKTSGGYTGDEMFYLEATYEDPKNSIDEYEFTEDSGVSLKVKKGMLEYTHMIALGGGELKDRLVCYFSIDQTTGKITEIDYIPRTDDSKIYLYDYGNCETKEELTEYSQKKAYELLKTDSQKMTLDDDIGYDVGDIITATDRITGITVSKAITKKILKVSNGVPKISYSIGDDI